MSIHKKGGLRSFVLLALLLAMTGAPLLSPGDARAAGQEVNAPWIGVWDTVVDGKDKFTLTIGETRRGLYGNYTPGNGQAAGRVYEGVLDLKWTQDGHITGINLKGRAQLKLSEDGKSFTGTSKTEGEDKEHKWTGEKVISFSGVWSGALSNNFQLTLTLSQTGDTFTGGGQVIFPGLNPVQQFTLAEGKVTDRTLTFKVYPTTGGTGIQIQHAGIEQLVLLADGKTLQGTLGGRPAVAAFAGPVEGGGGKAAPSSFTTSNKPDEFNTLYGVKEDGTLVWHRHVIRSSDRRRFQFMEPTKNVGMGWKAGLKDVLPAGLLGIYSLSEDGILRWFWHTGALTGAVTWREANRPVATGWTGFAKVIPMDKGVVYGILPDGKLIWLKHNNYMTGKVGANAWSGSLIVNENWHAYKTVFSGGNGVLYGVAYDGKLYWFRHLAYLSPLPMPLVPDIPGIAGGPGRAMKAAWMQSWQGPKEIAADWGSFTKIFSPGEGHIYAVKPTGELMYYRHLGWEDGSSKWDDAIAGPVGAATRDAAPVWENYVFAFARNTTSDLGSGNPEVDIVVH
jgi:hypothetical protein